MLGTLAWRCCLSALVLVVGYLGNVEHDGYSRRIVSRDLVTSTYQLRLQQHNYISTIRTPRLGGYISFFIVYEPRILLRCTLTISDQIGVILRMIRAFTISKFLSPVCWCGCLKLYQSTHNVYIRQKTNRIPRRTRIAAQANTSCCCTVRVTCIQ